MKLEHVAHDDVQVCVNDRTRSCLAPNTVRGVEGVLSAILSAAVRSRRLASSLGEGVGLRGPAAKRRRYLSDVQVEDLSEAAGEAHQLLVDVLAYTGLRIR